MLCIIVGLSSHCFNVIALFFNFRSSEAGTSQGKSEQEPSANSETLPLFYQPGKQGYYAPILGSASPTRLNAFRNVGR